MNENLRWARNVVNNNPYKSGSFVESIATAFLQSDDNNRFILNDAMTILRNKYPRWDIEERKD